MIIIPPYELCSKSKNPIHSLTKIIYYYYDSSVPPKYHRSYTITITSDSIRIIVDSYGDVINDKEFEIDSNQFELIKKSLVLNRIKKGKKIESKGCTGGTSDKIEYYDNDKCLLSASAYHCGNKDYGDLRGDIKNVAQDIRNLIPNFSELLKRDD
ncbi:MAG: hypothetical protein EPN82_04120 [Bacteroidetes bacterium]|nr:MAG: hypothetical protein EPN82_04120 [Bacteroidota bacterium]